MNINSKTTKTLLALGLSLPFITTAQAISVRVTVTSNAPTNGVGITPLWGGFHDGSFDSYNGGLSSQEGLERLAEDGNTAVISSDFTGGYTYVSGGVSGRTLTSQTTGRLDFTLGSPSGPPPILPGESASMVIDGLTLANNQYFSYASMVLVSNDYYVANGNPTAHDLSSLFSGGGPISFIIGAAGTVNDAGTEVNDFNTSAANGLFGLTGGQGGPNTGADENGVNANVVGDPFAGFLNPQAVPAEFNFNNYSNGIATVTLEVVPEPSSLALLGLGGVAFALRRRK